MTTAIGTDQRRAAEAPIPLLALFSLLFWGAGTAVALRLGGGTPGWASLPLVFLVLLSRRGRLRGRAAVASLVAQGALAAVCGWRASGAWGVCALLNSGKFVNLRLRSGRGLRPRRG